MEKEIWVWTGGALFNDPFWSLHVEGLRIQIVRIQGKKWTNLFCSTLENLVHVPELTLQKEMKLQPWTWKWWKWRYRSWKSEPTDGLSDYFSHFFMRLSLQRQTTIFVFNIGNKFTEKTSCLFSRMLVSMSGPCFRLHERNCWLTVCRVYSLRGIKKFNLFYGFWVLKGEEYKEFPRWLQRVKTSNVIYKQGKFI